MSKFILGTKQDDMIIVGEEADSATIASIQGTKVMPSYSPIVAQSRSIHFGISLDRSNPRTNCCFCFCLFSSAEPLTELGSGTIRHGAGVVDAGAGDISSCVVLENRRPARFLARESAHRHETGSKKRAGIAADAAVQIIVRMDRAIESGDDAARTFPGIFGSSGIASSTTHYRALNPAHCTLPMYVT